MRRKVIKILHLGLSLLGEKMEHLLEQQEAEIEHLRCHLADERRDLDELREVRLAEHGALKEISAVVGVDCMAPGFAHATAHRTRTLLADWRERINKLETLLSRLTPRTYREGDPRSKGATWWNGEVWHPLRHRPLASGDIYLDLPPPGAWPQIKPKAPYAVVLVIFAGTRLVVAEYPKRLDCFVLPGGKVEAGEDPYAAALREAKEEVGREVRVEATPFFVGESHNGKPMWGYRGALTGTVPEEWSGPEGRVRLSSIDEARQHYHPDFLPAFDRVMSAMWPDTLQKVTQERDALREAHREAQETLRDQEAATAKVTQERDEARYWLKRAVDMAKLWPSGGAWLYAWRDDAVKHLEGTPAVRIMAGESIDRLTKERDESRAELARLREQTTPRRAGSTGTTLAFEESVLVWSHHGRWIWCQSGAVKSSEWILPQPPPPPDEAWQEAEAEARKARSEVTRLADAMEP